MRTRHVAFLVLGLFASAGLFAWTATQVVWISAFAASILKAFLAIGLWATVLYFGLDIDTRRELAKIRESPIALGLLALAIALLLAPAVASGQPQEPIIQEARTHVGVTEQPPGSNEGPMVETYLASVGLDGGYPWCAAFVRYVMDSAGTERPRIRSAGATDYITRRSIDATEVIRGTATVPQGALSIHRQGSTWKGHIGIVVSDDLREGHPWENQCGNTIEGNTSPGTTGPQRDGDGVWRRHRCIQPGNYFRIVAFTPTR